MMPFDLTKVITAKLHYMNSGYRKCGYFPNCNNDLAIQDRLQNEQSHDIESFFKCPINLIVKDKNYANWCP